MTVMPPPTTFFSANLLIQIIDTRFAAMVLYARTWNVGAAEDIVQEALLKLLDQKKTPENPVAWLYKTIRNEAISGHRRALSRQKHETEAVRQKTDWFSEKDALIAKEAAEKLEKLPPEQREVVVLRIWGQLSFDEIAELTQAPKTSVYRMYTESLATLRRQLS